MSDHHPTIQKGNPLAGYPLDLLARWADRHVISSIRYLWERDRRIAEERSSTIEAAFLPIVEAGSGQHV